MKRTILCIIASIVTLTVMRPIECPAPLIWRKGEGWTYERAGVTAANNPVDQLKIGKDYQAKKDYGNAITAYRRLIRRWPAASAAQDARMGLAESLSAAGYHHKAFKEYQQLIEKNPSTEHFETVLQRQFEIGNLYMAGERDKAWGVRWFSSPEKAVGIYQQVIKNGPYASVAPNAQFRIGLTHEKLKEYTLAVKAYEKLIDRYPRHALVESAQFHIGSAYMKEARRSEYDQNAANQAITAFNDFLVRFPKSDNASEVESHLAAMKMEQGKGLFRIAQFYEKRKNLKAALIYYNEVIEQNPQSDLALAAKEKVASLTVQQEQKTAAP